MTRYCCQCERDLPRESYSKNQWRKKKGGMESRCKDCIGNQQAGDGVPQPSRNTTDSRNKNNDDLEYILQVEEIRERLRLKMEDDPMADRQEPALEDLRRQVRHFEALQAASDRDKDPEQWLRIRKLWAQNVKELEQALEKERVRSAVQQWESNKPDLNVDDENLHCPFCHANVPLDGTTYHPITREPVYHTRFFCCGVRICRACNISNRQDMIKGKTVKCPGCNGLPTRLPDYGFQMWLRFAKQGKSWAQAQVGSMHKYGKANGPKDIEKALCWYRLAADKGNLNAIMGLAEAYQIGDGVAKNHEEALRWFQKAADRGDDAAQYFLGQLHPSPELRLKYLTFAAMRGHAEAQCVLGESFCAGAVTIRSKAPLERGIIWLEQAAKRGFSRAQNKLSKAQVAREREVYGKLHSLERSRNMFG